MVTSGKVRKRDPCFESVGKAQVKSPGLTGALMPELFPSAKRETQNSCKPAGAKLLNLVHRRKATVAFAPIDSSLWRSFHAYKGSDRITSVRFPGEPD